MAIVAPLYTTKRYANATRKTEKLNASPPCPDQVKATYDWGGLPQFTTSADFKRQSVPST